jgi:hypothetical protein
MHVGVAFSHVHESSQCNCMQVRQHVGHKRTFMFLEQLIVKHGAHEQCLNIKECHQGLDFFFGNRSHAQKFVDFLQVRSLQSAAVTPDAQVSHVVLLKAELYLLHVQLLLAYSSALSCTFRSFFVGLLRVIALLLTT